MFEKIILVVYFFFTAIIYQPQFYFKYLYFEKLIYGPENFFLVHDYLQCEVIQEN